ncbi:MULTISPECIES: DUF1127 domain-containing protein [unclassified Paracoccus (in: a-proteobacteria)]|uniref:DUF1127 domain-containing protein n=1 Tax=unclassified Paracoccus (in: a-proteobacteria) TaxID=2688777 RepID=UPI0018A6B17B|nr:MULTISPECIES: DUF1127 domain-containing protein [unclassified Paracoccus (in: a-proteobacteria)]UXU76289.1 DUF1127 domain-containing protein [Paracoccus sp. SMMA_5]UXU82375.1 DUF1127 domain-containing protein [Paracoccus sp. SMMA_5_TC]
MNRTACLKSFFPHFPPGVPSGKPSPLLAWADRQRQRAALARLEDRMLDDIGVTRTEAAAECQRHD